MPSPLAPRSLLVCGCAEAEGWVWSDTVVAPPLSESISFLDSELAKNAPETPFVAGTATPSIADLLLIPECDQLVGFGMFDFTPYPKVQEWMAAVKASVPAYDEVYAVVTATVARFAAKK